MIRQIASTEIPFEVIAHQLPTDDDFMKDINALLAIAPSKIQEIQSELEKSEHFLNREELMLLIAKHTGDEANAKKVSRLISQLHRLISDSGGSLESRLKTLGAAIEQQVEKFTKSAQLVERLTKLFSNAKGIDRQYKSEKLAEATGQPIKELEIFCDLRPIFDETRKHVEGILPLMTFQIITDEDNNPSQKLEFRLTERQLLELCSETENAKKKLLSLKTLMNEKGFIVPNTTATLKDKSK